MKHILNNVNESEFKPYVTLNLEGVHYSGLTVEDSDYVDLGLPSGLLWAECNVGANSETEYGLLFQWGATEGHDYDTDAKDYSTWDTCPWGQSTPPMTTLDAEHDAAYQATNGVAHMPTEADFNELTANTTVTWVTNFNGSGVNGRKFTSKKEGYTDKYIFIPASGYAGSGSVYGRGTNGGVWSSSLTSSYPDYAWGLGFNSSYVGVYYDGRFVGRSVRGVKNK